MDYFTKWVEAKPFVRVTGQHIKTFVWEHIVCWFGLPSYIESDNGRQFAENPFKNGVKICISFKFYNSNVYKHQMLWLKLYDKNQETNSLIFFLNGNSLII